MSGSLLREAQQVMEKLYPENAVALGLTRSQLWHVVRAFLIMPTA